MNEEIKELKETLERSLQNPSLIDREKTERFYKGIINLQQKVEQLENIRKEAYEFTEWHYKDNQKFYKNEGIGLNYPECDALLNILNKGE